MIELNLLPDVKLQFVRAQKTRRHVIGMVSVGSFIALGIVAVFAIYVYAVQPLRGVVLDGQIKSANQKLTGVSDLNSYLTIQQQLNDLPALHDQKPIYSRIISWLPTLNPASPNNIFINELKIDSATDANQIVISAYTTTYTGATVFQSTLQSAQFTSSDTGSTSVPLFSSVALSDTALGQDANGNKVVDFTVTLEVDPSVFAFTTTNTAISVPTKNATNSAQSVPSVFSDVNGGTQ